MVPTDRVVPTEPGGLRDGDHDFQGKYAILRSGAALPAVFLHGTSDIWKSEAVEEGISFGGAFGQGNVGQGVVCHTDNQHISDAVRLYGDEPLILGKLFVGFDGVIQGVAENGADIQWVNKAAVPKGDAHMEVDLLFLSGSGLVADEDIQKFVSGLLIIFIAFHLALKGLQGFLHLSAAACLCLQYEQMVFQIMINAAHPLLIPDPIPVIIPLGLQLLCPVGGLHGITDIGSQIHTSEAGKNRSGRDGICDGRIVWHEAEYGEDGYKGSQHQHVYQHPHPRVQAQDDL